MSAFVLDYKKPLMSCSEARAHVQCLPPFSIQLVDRCQDQADLQPVILTLDTSSNTTSAARARVSRDSGRYASLAEIKFRGLAKNMHDLQHNLPLTGPDFAPLPEKTGFPRERLMPHRYGRFGMILFAMIFASCAAWATQAGTVLQVVDKATPVETVSIGSASVGVGGNVQISAILNGATQGSAPTGSVVFTLTSGSTTVLTSPAMPVGNNSVATWNASPSTAGTFTVNAAYSGDANYTSVNASDAAGLSVSGPYFTFTMPAKYQIKQGETVNIPVTILGYNGFSGPVVFTISGFPSTMTCGFAPGSNPTALVSESTTVQVGNTATVSTLTITTIEPDLTTLSFLVFLGLPVVGWNRRKMLRRGTGLAVFALCGAALLTMSGCGGPMLYQQKQGTPLGDYQITLTGTSGSLNQTATMVVTVTQ